MRKNEEAKTIISYTLLFFVTILFLLTIYFLTIQGNNEVNLAKSSEHWPAVDGEIVESELESFYVRRRRGSGYVYNANITYIYSIGQQMYEGYAISIGEPKVSTRRQEGAQSVLNKYPVGKEVKVYFNPTDPQTAVLEPGVTTQNYGQWAAVLLYSIIIFGIFILFGNLIRKARHSP